jgi:hypothetical protein
MVAMPPAAVMATIHMGAGAMPAVMMMTAALDDDGLRARDRRYGNDKCAKGCNDKSKLSHDFLILLGVSVRIKLAVRGNVPPELLVIPREF